MEINLDYSLEGLILKLKLQYCAHLIRRAGSLEKTLILEKIRGKRRRGWQRMRRVDGITDSVHRSLSKVWEIPEDRGDCSAAARGVTGSDKTSRLNNET